MSHTILLVEDDANIRQMLSIALGAEGYLCVEAASVREALSLFNQHRPDLVILDLGYLMVRAVKYLNVLENPVACQCSCCLQEIRS